MHYSCLSSINEHYVLFFQLLFEGTTAVGVEYEVNTVKYRASGNTVILSAGAVMSPQLLLLSGIGPREDLEHLKVSSQPSWIRVARLSCKR